MGVGGEEEEEEEGGGGTTGPTQLLKSVLVVDRSATQPMAADAPPTDTGFCTEHRAINPLHAMSTSRTPNLPTSSPNVTLDGVNPTYYHFALCTFRVVVEGCADAN
jgi:hypothetical protein